MNAFSRLSAVAMVIVGLLCLVPVSAAPAPAGGRMLLIKNTETGFSENLPLVGVESLAIRFFHSYDRQWVVESFRVLGGKFVPTEVSYGDDSYDYRDQRYNSRASVSPNEVRLEIAPRPKDHLPAIAARVAHTTPQQLILTGARKFKVYLFTQWGEPGQPLVFSIK